MSSFINLIKGNKEKNATDKPKVVKPFKAGKCQNIIIFDDVDFVGTAQ